MVETAAVGSPHFSPILASIYNSFTPIQNASIKSPSNFASTPIVRQSNTPSTADHSSDQGHFSNETTPEYVSHTATEPSYNNGPTRLDFSDDTLNDPEVPLEPSPVIPSIVNFGTMDDVDDIVTQPHDEIELCQQ
jgi:hypothetical protein